MRIGKVGYRVEKSYTANAFTLTNRALRGWTKAGMYSYLLQGHFSFRSSRYID